MSYYKVYLMSNLIRDYNKLPKNLWQYKATKTPTTFEKSNVLKTMSSYKVVIVDFSIHISSKVWMKSTKNTQQKEIVHIKLVMLGWWEECSKMDGLHNPQGRASQIGHINHVKNYIAIINPLTLTCRVRLPRWWGSWNKRPMMMRQQWSSTQWLV
jgi:hypothetical protein